MNEPGKMVYRSVVRCCCNVNRWIVYGGRLGNSTSDWMSREPYIRGASISY